MLNSVSSLARQIGELTGASQRQLDYWARHGVFGREFVARGSGTRRPWWTPNIAEAIYVCAQLANLGASTDVMASASRVVMPRPVRDGEWLLVTADGAMRIDHFCLDDAAPRVTAYVIPLRSFASVTPTDGSEGAAVPAAAASAPSP